MQLTTRTKEAILVAIAVVSLVAGLAIWKLYYKGQLPQAPITGEETPTGEVIENPSLGSQLYEQANNPISGKLPESVAPAPNPLKGVYKNPFE